MTYDVEVEVLIVGGGLAGLSAAVFLAWQGTEVLLVERRGSSLVHPRARTINPRSVEVFAQAGLADVILSHRSFTDHDSSVLFRAETLAGPEKFRSPLDPPGSITAISPWPWAPIDQDKLETLLVTAARDRGARVVFGTELVDFTDDGDGITARLRDVASGRPQTVRARYLVAADGGRSGIREALGIGTHGHGSIGHTMTLVFEADLTEPLRGRKLGVCHLDRPVSGTVLLSHDGDQRWVFSVPYRPEAGETLADFDNGRSVALIREAIGIPDLAVRVVPQLADGTRVLGYELAARVADTFQRGRVLLVGDAGHVVPPTGAFGASTGIADAHNLAWKLAAVVAGKAGPGLLASYDAERRPVADLTMEQALLQLWSRTNRHTPAQAVFSPLDYYATVFGYRYSSDLVVDPPEDLPAAVAPQELSGQPGTRAPHVPLTRDGRSTSTLDLFGRSFVLLAGSAGGGWVEAMPPSAPEAMVVDAYRIGVDLADTDGEWARRYGVEPDGVVLVRPDGFVAWRSARSEPAPATVLSTVLAQLLDRRTSVAAR
jgi:2-polyprenyl-6-methoxyphenol hydroxylase-like FAD-dependent oxidoreductase